ncbi:MAG TPA: glycosyltransferase family A protein [Candidatus Binatia bacterium]|nr:glycosyltransferase family A protein [Candidatus Binatia bacterium]
MSSGPLVSVLVPVYNGERHLAEAIDSVLAQTYERWRCTIVDNCSTDGTAKIAARYAARDGRIRVHTNERFVGVIENHNIAFRLVPPESAYVKVLHADDWLFPRCLAEMVAVAEAHPSVGLVGAYALRSAWVDLDGLPYPSTVVPGRTLGRLGLLGGPYVFGSPTSVMFRADLVRARDPFFEPGSIHADEAACYEILRSADFGFVHQVLTFTRKHPGSVSASFAERYNTYLAGNLAILKRYGPVFLSPEEYERRLRERLTQYYRYLAESLLERREPAFWAYHREALAQAGFPLDRGRLARTLATELLQALACPHRMVGQVARLVRRPRPARDATAAAVTAAAAHWKEKAAEKRQVAAVVDRALPDSDRAGR